MEEILAALIDQQSIYDELMSEFYSPIQLAQEEELQGLRDAWTAGNFPAQDRYSMEIQTLRETYERYRNVPEAQDLLERVQQLESMHEDITRDLQESFVAPSYSTLNGAGGGLRKSRKSRKMKSKKSKKTRRSKGKIPRPV